jgi:hypothetical protein
MGRGQRQHRTACDRVSGGTRLEFDLGPAGGVRLVFLDGDRSVGDQWSVFRVDSLPGYAAAVATSHRLWNLEQFAWQESAGVLPRQGRTELSLRKIGTRPVTEDTCRAPL